MSKVISESLVSMVNLVSNLEAQLSQLRFCMPSTIEGATSNPVETGKVVRRLIASMVRLQDCRKCAHSFNEVASVVASQLAYSVSFRGASIRRQRNYPTNENPTVIAAVPTATDLATHKRLCEKFNETVGAIHSLATAFSNLVAQLRSGHANIVKRKATCLGYRDNVSLLLAYGMEKPNGKQPHYNFVFGSCRNTETLGVLRLPLVGKKEGFPTMANGEDVLRRIRDNQNAVVRNARTKCTAERLNDLSGIIGRMYPYIRFDRNVLALIPHYSKINEVAARWGSTRLNYQNVSTIPTSKPIQVATTPRGENVFEMEATWVEHSTWKPGMLRDNLRKVVDGKVYFVSNPGDNENQRYDVYHGNETRNLQTVIDSLNHRAKLQEERLERDKLAKLSLRQRVAELLVDCRTIPVVSLEDSYRAGNCRPGTINFCFTLGIDVNETPTVSGKRLAKLWNDKQRPQMELFRNVVVTIKRQQPATTSN